MSLMRAKVQVESVNSNRRSDEVVMTAVYTSRESSAEDNTFAEATPNAKFTMTIDNRALHGKVRPGMKFYVDFTEAQD